MAYSLLFACAFQQWFQLHIACFIEHGSGCMRDCRHLQPFTSPRHRASDPCELVQHSVFRGALRWLVSLWGVIDPGGMAMPLSPQVFIADDLSVWAPSQGLLPLWTLLRLTMLRCVWVSRCSAKQASGSGFSRANVVSAFVREIRGLILQDWACVEGDVRLMAGVPPSWFRGRAPEATLDGFTQEWCHRGVLASVMQAADGRPKLAVHLSVHTPPGHGLHGVAGVPP